MKKTSELDIKGTIVRVVKVNDEDYICLTDMLKAKDGEFFVTDWLRNRNTLEFTVSGNAFTTLRLIMANSPQLEIKRASIRSKSVYRSLQRELTQ